MYWHQGEHNETKQAKRNKVYLANPIKNKEGDIVKYVKAAGDTVRGMLHDQTYYGKIKDNNQNIQTVLRTPLDFEHFKDLKSLEDIVDKGVRDAVIAQVNLKLQTVETFNDVFLTEFYMKTNSGTFDGPVIKKVRVFQNSNKLKSPLMIKKQTYSSTKEYKNYYYAATAKNSNFMIALYREPQVSASQKVYNYELISLWQWAKEHRSVDYIPPQKRTDKGEFIGIINQGTTVLFYKDSPEELKNMSSQQLSQRMYKITVFEQDNKNIRLWCCWHREARPKKDIKKSSKIKWESGVPLLCISPGTYQNHTLFEGIDFEITSTGEIIFKE